MLDTAKYERDCKNCGKRVKDLTKHGLEGCKVIEHHRKVYILRNVPQRTRLLNIREVFEAAMTKKCFEGSV